MAEVLEYVPARFKVIRHVRPKLACRCCDGIVQVPAPSRPISWGLAGPGLLAMLLTTKYADGIPLYRFEKMLSRHGIDIPRQTLARWMIQCGEQLQPLLNLLRDKLLDYPELHCDETRLHAVPHAHGMSLERPAQGVW